VNQRRKGSGGWFCSHCSEDYGDEKYAKARKSEVVEMKREGCEDDGRTVRVVQRRKLVHCAASKREKRMWEKGRDKGIRLSTNFFPLPHISLILEII